MGRNVLWLKHIQHLLLIQPAPGAAPLQRIVQLLCSGNRETKLATL